MTRCPRCAAEVRYGDLRLYDYRAGWLCVSCEQPGDRPVMMPGTGVSRPVAD